MTGDDPAPFHQFGHQDQECLGVSLGASQMIGEFDMHRD